jgi:hypothetical protein
LSYAHIFITYFLVTKQKKKQRDTKKQSKKKKQINTKKSKKKKERKTKNKAKRKNTVILPLANCTLNSPGVSSTGPHDIGTGITPGEFLV